MAAPKYMVTAYQRYSAMDDQVVKHKTGLTAKAAAKLAVTMARSKNVDAGVAVRAQGEWEPRVGQTTSSRFGNNVLMSCQGDDPHGAVYGKKRRQIVKCNVKPEFKTAIKASRKRSTLGECWDINDQACFDRERRRRKRGSK